MYTDFVSRASIIVLGLYFWDLDFRVLKRLYKGLCCLMVIEMSAALRFKAIGWYMNLVVPFEVKLFV